MPTVTIDLATVIGDSNAKIMGLVQAMSEYIGKLLDATKAGDAFADAQAAATNSITAMRSAAGGEIKDLDLLRISAMATMKGIELTDGQMQVLISSMKKFADATGKDARAEIESLLSALASGRTTGLKRFGIELEEGADKATVLQGTIEQLDARFSQISGGADSAGDAAARLETEWANLTQQFQVGIDKSEALKTALQDLGENLAFATGQAEGAGIAFGDVVAWMIKWNAANAVIRTQRDLWGDLTIAMNPAAEKLRQMTEFMDWLRGATERATAAAREFENAAAAAFEGADVGPTRGTRGVMSERELAARQAGITAARRGGRGGGGGRRRESAESLNARTARGIALDAQIELIQAEQEANARRIEQREKFNERMAALGESRQEMEERFAQEDREREERRAREEYETNERRLQEEGRINQERLRAMASTAAGIGAAAEQAAGLLGMGEAEKLTIKGMTEAVLSAVEFAALNPIGGVAHALASALAFAGAVKVSGRSKRATAQGAAMGTYSGGTGGAMGAGYSAGGGGGGGAGGRPVTVNVYSSGQLLVTDRDVRRAVRDALYAADAAGDLDESPFRSAA